MPWPFQSTPDGQLLVHPRVAIQCWVVTWLSAGLWSPSLPCCRHLPCSQATSLTSEPSFPSTSPLNQLLLESCTIWEKQDLNVCLLFRSYPCAVGPYVESVCIRL